MICDHISQFNKPYVCILFIRVQYKSLLNPVIQIVIQ